MSTAGRATGPAADHARALVLASRYSVDITRIARQSLGEGVVENRDIQILIVLRRLPGTTPASLAAATGAARAVVSRALARLESRGLIRRTPSTVDRRNTRVSLTRTGHRRIRTFGDRLDAYFRAGAPLVKETLALVGVEVPDGCGAPGGRADGALHVAEALSRAGAPVADESMAVAAAYGLTGAPDRFALGLLHEHGATRPRHLADELDLTSGGTSQLLDRLERAGLIRRRHDPGAGDRRAVLITLTPRGQRAAQALVAVFARHCDDVARALALTVAR